MKSEALALVGVKCFSSDEHLLKALAEQISKVVGIRLASSIYKIEGVTQKPKHIHDLRRVSNFEGLAVCFRGAAKASAREILNCFERLEEDFRNEIMRRSASLNLLDFGGETMMTPSLTIPHPEFHLEPEQLIPAAEVYPDYIHPVLQVSIQSLVAQLRSINKVEFFAQGKSLLDQ